jgi:hypothetical protein
MEFERTCYAPQLLQLPMITERTPDCAEIHVAENAILLTYCTMQNNYTR